jgi:DNA polymerase-1
MATQQPIDPEILANLTTEKAEVDALLATAKPVRSKDLSVRKHPLAKCEECPLLKAPCALSVGSPDARIMVVARSPGYHEAMTGRPFTGMSGKVLDHLLKENGVSRDEAFLTNVVLCHTDAPTKEAVDACSPRLKAELAGRDTIIAAGAEAVSAIIGRGSVASNRGYVHKGVNGSRVVATTNPAIVLRDDSTFPSLQRDFRQALNPLPTPKLPTVRWTNEVSQAKEWMGSILDQGYGQVSCDIESRGLDHTAPIVSFGISVSGDKAIAFGERPCANQDWLTNYLRPFLERERVVYLWHNGKFDVRNLRHKGINARVDEDTLLLSYALDERSDEEQVHKLENLLKWELGWPDYDPPVVRHFKTNADKRAADGSYAIPVPNELYPYNALDCAGAAQLFPILKQRAMDDGVWLKPYRERLIPHSEDFVRMELQGMGYDVNRAGDMLDEEVKPELNRLRSTMQLKVGDGNYNPNSSVQNAGLVYDTWGLVHNIDRRGKERSVDKPVYTELAAGRFFIAGDRTDKEQLRDLIIEWAQLLKEFKSLDKQRGTYFEGLILAAIKRSGRVYTDLKLHGTVTGRPSSSRPNLLNVTRPKEGLPNIRSLFVADDGCLIFNADYSQAELRCIAYLSGDSGLTGAYQRGDDIHSISALRFYGKGFTKEQRSRAKNMNFGVPYLQGAGTFQEKHDIPEDEAQEFIDWWKGEFSTVWEWHKEIREELHGEGCIRSPYGRKRRFYLLTSQNKDSAHREAVNFKPQSIANDFTLSAVHRLMQELDPKIATISLTVYDSIVGNVRSDAAVEVARVIKQVMESIPKQDLGWDFPFEAEVSVGPSWGEVKELSL